LKNFKGDNIASDVNNYIYSLIDSGYLAQVNLLSDSLQLQIIPFD